MAKPVIRNARVRQVTATTGEVDYRVVAIVRNDLNNIVDKVNVEFVPPYVGKPQPAFAMADCKFRKALSNNRKRYVDRNVDFDANALNKSYTMIMKMLDVSGQVVGKVVTRDVTVDNNGEDNDPAVPAVVDVNINQTGESGGVYQAQVEVLVNSDANSTVATVEVTLSQSAERAQGPAPSPTVVNCLPAGTSGEDRRFTGSTGFASSAGGFYYVAVAVMKNAQGTVVGTPFKIADILVEG